MHDNKLVKIKFTSLKLILIHPKMQSNIHLTSENRHKKKSSKQCSLINMIGQDFNSKLIKSLIKQIHHQWIDI